MNTKAKPKDPETAGKRRAVIYLDRGLFRRLREVHVERDVPLSHVVQDIVARHFEREDRVLSR